MKIKATSIIIITQFLLITCEGLINADISSAQEIIINHTNTNISIIPSEWIDSVKTKIRLHFGHRSHGRQLTEGMDDIQLMEPSFSLNYDPGYSNYSILPNSLNIYNRSQYIAEYIANVQTELNRYRDLNVSLFIWCVEFMVDMYTEEQVISYLQSMETLEDLYPNVTFIYSTASAGGYGREGDYNRYLRNMQIRQYCIENDKILFDFEDLDSWWYNEEQDRWEEATFEYEIGQQLIQIPTQHPEYGTSWVTPVHINETGWLQKGKAAWWMLARISGWGGSIADIGGNNNYKKKIPKAIELYQNYPNPFNATTTISYEITIGSNIKLTLYDIQGKKIQVLLNDFKAPGHYKVEWNAGEIPSGIYLYQIQTNQGSFQRKCLIIK